MNYYIVHPTANTFAEAAGANKAYSAAIIGAASFSAILIAVFHCSILMGHTNSKQGEMNIIRYKRLLISSTICAICGNTVQALGVSRLSVPITVLGRFLIGLSAADIVHRQFVSAFLHPSLVVAESARLVHFQATGLVVGLFIGSLVESVPYRTVRYGVQFLQLPNWIMASFWFLHLSRLVFSTRRSKSQKNVAHENTRASSVDRVENMVVGESSDSSSDSDPTPGGPARLYHQASGIHDRDETVVSRMNERSIRRAEVATKRRSRKQNIVALIRRLRKLTAYNIAIPVMLALAIYTTFAQEILFSSCALIADRYFYWRGSIAGFFLGCLSLLILPVDFVCEQVARRYEERTTIKQSILLFGIGLLVMVNWGSVFAMVANLRILFTETQDMRHHYYDWLLGIPQYLAGFLISFVGLRALHGASRSLLSKILPPNPRRNTVMNLGTVVTLFGLFAQLLANIQIVAVSLSHRLINTDIVNSLLMPMLIGCILVHYFVRKHYFFLM